MQSNFWAGSKNLDRYTTPVKGQGINAVKFLGWLKIFGPAQSILGHVKGQEIKLFSNFMPIYFIFLLVQNPINMKGGFFFLNQ